MTMMEVCTVIACRVDCDFCPQTLLINQYSSKNRTENINYGNPDIMSLETFKTCIDKIPSYVPIVFSGYAEPFLNPNCASMMLYAHETGHSINVFSTLVGMKLDDIDAIKHIPFKGFEIHLPDKQMFAKISVNEKYIQVLKKLLTSKISNITAMSMGELHPKIKKVLESNIDPSVMISRCGALKNVEVGFEKKTGPLVCHRASKYELKDKLDENVLLPNGDVSLCCNDYGLQNILGNLLKEDYNSLFNNESFKKIKEKMKSYDSDIICRLCHESISEKELNERRKIIDEFPKNKHAASIITAYKNLLQRVPDRKGFEVFYSRISKQELTINELENEIKQSQEYISLHPPKLKLKKND